MYTSEHFMNNFLKKTYINSYTLFNFDAKMNTLIKWLVFINILTAVFTYI